jgi:hypothetical protein
MRLSEVPRAGCSRWWARVVLLVLAGAAAVAGGAGCGTPQVKAWQRANLAKRAMRFDDGLEARFKQHMFAAREGAEGGYGDVGGGCGCN